MARPLAHQPAPSAEDIARAVDHARRACELTGFARHDCIDLPADVLDAAGDSDGAEAIREKIDAP